MFEKASKMKLRFDYKGSISVEDLWDLNVKDLDGIYIALHKSKKKNEDESLLETKTDEVLNLQIEIVKHIFNVKIEEKKKQDERSSRLAKKRQLQGILANKQNADLEAKSMDELKALINDLDVD